MTYRGSCHCGNVAYEVDAQLDGALACNCSMCQRKGALHWFVPREKFKLLTDPSAMSTYTFNRHVIQHRFCSNCGIHAFGEGVDPKGTAMAAVNVNCLEGVDVTQVPVQHYDGRSH